MEFLVGVGHRWCFGQCHRKSLECIFCCYGPLECLPLFTVLVQGLGYICKGWKKSSIIRAEAQEALYFRNIYWGWPLIMVTFFCGSVAIPSTLIMWPRYLTHHIFLEIAWGGPPAGVERLPVGWWGALENYDQEPRHHPSTWVLCFEEDREGLAPSTAKMLRGHCTNQVALQCIATAQLQ